MEALKKDIFTKDYLGKAVVHVWTIEFQKCGLPHIHMIIFLDPRDKLCTPQKIDSVLSAEFPDPDEEPELFQLVLKFMVHTPCGPANPNAPCMRNGSVLKVFLSLSGRKLLSMRILMPILGDVTPLCGILCTVQTPRKPELQKYIQSDDS